MSGYVGVTYDVTDYINFDSDNTLVVRVDATQYEGWFYEGAGIYRHVWLNQHNNLYIPESGLYVVPKVKGKNAIVTIETTVENKNLNASQSTVYSYITDKNGKIIGTTSEQKAVLPVNGNATVKQQITINNAHLWNLDDPYLYRAIAVVKQNGQIINQSKSTFGVRTIAFDAKKGLFLNGKHLKIQGTNNHQDHAGIGSALPDYMQFYRIKLLKKWGRMHTEPATMLLLQNCFKLVTALECWF